MWKTYVWDGEKTCVRVCVFVKGVVRVHGGSVYVVGICRSLGLYTCGVYCLHMCVLVATM